MNTSNINLSNMTNTLSSKFNETMKMIGLDRIDFSSIAGFIWTVILVIFTTTLILWLFESIGLYKMAKNKKDEYAFLAFIPYFCLFTKGKIVGNTKLFGIDIKHTEFLLPALIIACMLPLTRHISCILLVIFSLAILYRIYQQYVPNMAIILFILTIIFPVIEPFVIFFIRNNQPNSNTNTNNNN